MIRKLLDRILGWFRPRKQLPTRPLFLVVTPTIAGRARLLRAAIHSVQRQTCWNYRHVVIGDGPAPDCQEACKELGVEYVERPKGGSWGYAARNYAIEAYDADYVMFLDDDNVYGRDCLMHIGDLLQGKPDLVVFQISWIRRWVQPAVRAIIPGGPELKLGDVDMMCLCIRMDIAKQCRFQPTYEQDYHYAKAVEGLSCSKIFLPRALGTYSWSWEQDGCRRLDGE